MCVPHDTVGGRFGKVCVGLRWLVGRFERQVVDVMEFGFKFKSISGAESRNHGHVRNVKHVLYTR